MKEFKDVSEKDNLQKHDKIKKIVDLRENISNEYSPLEDLNKKITEINETEDSLEVLYSKKELLTEWVL